MTTTPPPVLYRHTGAADWGLGAIIHEQDGKVTLVFEHAGPKVLMAKLVTQLLTREVLPPEVAIALDAKLRRRKRHVPLRGAEKMKAAQKAAKKAEAAQATAAFPSFEAQVATFEALFPGGFRGDPFTLDERGAAGARGKAGYKEAAIALAQQELSAERFASASTAELFDSAKRVLASTNIAFPIEGSIPFGQIAEVDRPPMLAALRRLLHETTVEYPARFDAFVKSVNLKNKAGNARALSWPTATLIAALFDPIGQVAVKPTCFASQAALLGKPMSKTQPVTGENYLRFRDIALETQAKLLAAGHQPRDLMDVYSFIWRTHNEKPRT